MTAMPSSPPPILALDVGGTTVLAGVVDPRGGIVGVRHGPIDEAAERDALLDRLATDVVALLPAVGDTAPIVLAFPAPFDYRAGVAWLEHKFAALHGVDVRSALADRAGVAPTRLHFCNDAAAAGLGEAAALGAVAGRSWVVLLGTGLGSALIEDGRFVADSSIGDTTELWCRRLADGRSADAVVSARGLAAALGVAPTALPSALGGEVLDADVGAALRGWTDDVAEVLGEVLAREPADQVVIGGGAGAALRHFGPALGAALGVPLVAARGGPHVALVGAALSVVGGVQDSSA